MDVILDKYKSLLNHDKNEDHEGKLIVQVELFHSGRMPERIISSFCNL